jgi:PAS domain S-box-containing protein
VASSKDGFFLNDLVKFLGELTETDYVIIDVFKRNNPLVAKTIAIYAKGDIIPNFEYELKCTPCENVMGKSLCVYKKNIQKLFPKDKLLEDMNVESYIGIPLWDSLGQAIGLIAFMHSKPINDSETLELILQIAANTTSQEIEKLEIEKIVQKRTKELNIKNKQFENELKERKLSDEALHNSEEKYRLLFDMMPDGVYKSTDEGKFIDANTAMFKMLGYDSKEELLAIDIKTQLYFEISDRESVALQENRKELGIYRMKKKDGSEIWVEDHGWLNYDKIKNVLYHEGIIRDVSERKKVELELIKAKEKAEESKDLYFGLFNNSTIGLYQTTPSGQVLSANNSLIKMLKFDSLKDLLQRDLTKGSYVDENKRIEFKTILQEKGKVTDFESNWYTKHGEIITVLEGAMATKNAKGEIIRYDGAVQDITFKKKIQQELIIAKEKAEESDRLKSAFLANMSHEIRTPMNGILGFSDLLKTPNLSGEKQQRYIEVIEKSGKRMLSIINDIVDISKIEAGLMNIEIKESNVNDQIEYIYTFFKPEVEAKGMHIFFKNALSTNEATIKTDREKLFAILTNLVKNAIKYSNEGSIEFGYEKKECYLEFFVKDTGIGIPKERQEDIFERFIQADIIDTMARQGAGLGLSITKAYIEMLGGKIWVESEKGIGSTFYFTLPYNAELKEKNSSKDNEVTDNTKKRIKNLKILIAEDDEASELLLSINLSEFSNEIIKARTGREAIEACRNNPNADLVLMDIQMPDLNGYEATRQIRQFNKDVVIIAQTAYGLTGDREKSLNAGCNDYITKPIKKPELDSLIQKYFNK